MNFPSTVLPEKSWSLSKQILYSVMYESGASFVCGAPDGKVFAVQYPGKPLWLYADENWGKENLLIFFDYIAKTLFDKNSKIQTDGLITSKWAADICPWPAKASWELAAFYLPKPLPHISMQGYSLTYPKKTDIPILSEWIKDFYLTALDTAIENEYIAKAIINSRNFYCLKFDNEDLAAMGMLVPLPYGMCRLNLIYTPPGLRNKGLGKKITAAISYEAQKRGSLPCLYARVDNEPACALYRSLGFVEAGRLMELRF